MGQMLLVKTPAESDQRLDTGISTKQDFVVGDWFRSGFI
jgi:hypothetical protein